MNFKGRSGSFLYRCLLHKGGVRNRAQKNGNIEIFISLPIASLWIDCSSFQLYGVFQNGRRNDRLKKASIRCTSKSY